MVWARGKKIISHPHLSWFSSGKLRPVG